ncbi:MAG: polysaccharide pyruvyl transferase family protein [Lentisphaerae bacterium]|nr:polysaccharide pyruvyl transferase family protein [Lentisphaerota bacterium]
MKVAIITYHCAPSYGAVLQAYALQEAVRALGHTSAVIDYVPAWRHYVRLRDICATPNPAVIVSRWNTYRLTRRTRQFVNARLALTERRYASLADLEAAVPACEAAICGSDQVWHPKRFDSTGEFDKAYFLAFGGAGAYRRVAYAPSFGVPTLSPGYRCAIRPWMERFSSIGLRERSAAESLSAELGRDIPWVCDPTLLLGAEALGRLADGVAHQSRPGLVVSWLSFRRELYLNVFRLLRTLTGAPGAIIGRPFAAWFESRGTLPGVEEWVSLIRSARFVLTDSFHTTAFAILFRRPFLVLAWADASAARNDRLVSLLERLGLSERIVYVWDESVVRRLEQTPIDWEAVEVRLARWQADSRRFLQQALT